MGSLSPDIKAAWVVFLTTTPSYLPGVLVLAHSLRKHNSKYPLIVAVNPTLPREAVDALEAYGLEVRVVRPLLPSGPVTLIAERFADTWTKVRLFDFIEFDRLALIDGDMMVMKNMDELLTWDLQPDQIAASHACVCNLDKSSWADPSWTRENCAFTPTYHPEALTKPTPAGENPPTHSLLNSGLVILTPSKDTMKKIDSLLESESPEDQDLVKSWMFPDQDLLAHVFRGKWVALPWIYNAIKTMRYWHGNFYRDEEVKNLHYICDKPWKRRPKRVEATKDQYTVEAGDYAGIHDMRLAVPQEDADAVTHGWWWAEYEIMRKGMVADDYAGLGYLERLVAK